MDKTIRDTIVHLRRPADAINVVTALSRRAQERDGCDRVRAASSRRVISRSGDVFGPTVNLASGSWTRPSPAAIRLDGVHRHGHLRSPEAGRYRVGQCHEVVAREQGRSCPLVAGRTSPTRPLSQTPSFVTIS